MNEYVAGSTSIVDVIFFQDSTKTDGSGKTVNYNDAGLTCYYKRSNGTASVVVTLANITTLGTYVSGGLKAIDSTNMLGAHEWHPPNAAFAAGAKEVTFFFQGATGLAPRPIKYRILAVDPDTAGAVAGSYPSDAKAINGDTTAPGNLALTYNGTGYFGATAPAQQQQLSFIAVSGGPNATASTISITTGTETGTVANTTSLDGVYDQVAQVGGAGAGVIDFYYQFNLSGTAGAMGINVDWYGYVAGAGNTVKVYAYNWGNTAWDQIGSIPGVASAVNGEQEWDITTAHTGTGGNLGLVRIRFNGTSLTASSVYTDRILLSYVVMPLAALSFNPPTHWSSMLITAAGNVGIDWANVANPTTVVDLTQTTIKGIDGVTFPATVASPTNITAGTITTVTNLTNAPTAGDFTATMKTSLNAATPTANLSPADPVLPARTKQALLTSYSSQVLALFSGVTPKLYLRMDATVAANGETNIGSGATNGTYSGSVVLAQPGATADGDFSAQFGGANAVLQGTGLNTEDGATYTFRFVITPTTNATGIILYNDDGLTYTRMRFYQSGGFLKINGFQAAPIPVGATTDVCVVANTTTGSVYVNGIFWGTNTNFKILVSGNAGTNWTVGARSDGAVSFPGTIDEVFVYRFAANQDQVLATYNLLQSAPFAQQSQLAPSAIQSLVNQIVGAGNTTNPASRAIVNRKNTLPFFCAARYERVVTISIGDSNENKDSYGWMGGWANALNKNGGLWATGLLSAGSANAPSNGYGCAGGGGQGSGSCGANSGAPSALDALMPAGSSGALPQYSYTASGAIPDVFLLGPTPLGVFFPGMSENIRLHLTTGVNPGWTGTFTLGARWNASGPESNFGQIPLTPSGAISTAGASVGVVDQSWDIPAGTLGGTEQIRADFGDGDSQTGGAGSGPVFFTYWQAERRDQRTGFSHHCLGAAGGTPTKFILQALQAWGQTAMVEHFREAMLYAGPSKLCLIRICEGFNDRSDTTASWDKSNSTYDGPASNTQQGFQNNTEGLILFFQAAWVAAGFSLANLYFVLTPSHATATPDDAQIQSYRAACDTLSGIYTTAASVHLDLLIDQADLSARLMYENTDPINGIATPEPHLIYTGSDYVAAAEVGGLMPTGAEIILDAAMRSLTQQGYTVTRAPNLDHLNADITSRMASGVSVTVSGYATGQDPATLVLDTPASGHNTANTIGAKINAAGASGDPLASAVPGTYAPGEAGYVLGHLPGNNVTITPIQAAQSPSRSQQKRDLSLFELEGPTETFVITDALNNPINLSGKQLRFTAFLQEQTSETTIFTYDTTTGSQITITGTSSNNVNVTLKTTDTATPQTLAYALWNMTDNVVLAYGKLDIQAIKQ